MGKSKYTLAHYQFAKWYAEKLGARKMHYDEAIFIEDSNDVIFHDIKSGYTERCHITDVYYD